MKKPECCEPLMLATPSGRCATHARDCSVAPGQRVGYELGIVGAKVRHPAGGSSLGRLQTWLKHTPDDDCEACSYVNHHLDDADDDLEAEV